MALQRFCHESAVARLTAVFSLTCLISTQFAHFDCKTLLVVQAQGVAGRVGYEYMGKVNFVHEQKRAVPILDMSSLGEATGPSAGSAGEHYTVLVTRSGHSFTKR